MARNKRKHIYDFVLECEWKIISDNGGVSNGRLVVNDITADKDYEFDVTTTKPCAALDVHVRKYVKTTNSGLQSVLLKAFETFNTEFIAK